MTETWIYERTADNSARFVLGTVGVNPLVCVGVNPSTAAPGDPDRTVSKVMGFAARNGFDSWVMLNLYPQRSIDPKGMHLVHDPRRGEPRSGSDARRDREGRHLSPAFLCIPRRCDDPKSP